MITKRHNECFSNQHTDEGKVSASEKSTKGTKQNLILQKCRFYYPVSDYFILHVI